MSALLRVAGLPMRLWTAAGNPELVADLRELLAEEAEYAAYARALADWLGSVIPDAEDDRAELLALRRDLHNGRPVSSALPELAQASAWSTALGLRRAALDEDIERERERLSRLPWSQVDEAVARSVPDLVADVARRVEAGENWGGKRLRQRSEYLLRMIARGAAKPTPRGWLAHVAQVGVAGTVSWPVIGSCSAQWVSNVNADRGQADLDGATITLNGLNWVDGDRFRCWSATRVVELRRTPLLDAIRNVLADGVHDVDELVRRAWPRIPAMCCVASSGTWSSWALCSCPGRRDRAGALPSRASSTCIGACPVPCRRISWPGPANWPCRRCGWSMCCPGRRIIPCWR
ncbi:hypothetical protein [Kutzneria kofuensis]|uniref:Lantibiotic dehydratase N-terminal domain-containing protein n=1 Tax=Kutzneria kofuensis TaxID=103725 RepID=A0A7W9KDE1_9PSEU|nr:hypothetical protein [Kutzneria kofuensis]MBB5890534.1 hypothetical protein [Kutzneria kofuensis]